METNQNQITFPISGLADYLGVPQHKIRQWEATGLIIPIREENKICKFTHEHADHGKLLLFLEENGVTQPEAIKVILQTLEFFGCYETSQQLRLMEEIILRVVIDEEGVIDE